ncbi:MAG: T9SS type A sorting domain-containing protein [Bacteroidales bacterium]|nr:T9SS type A sorting domain-containing protein [Bacteroidales bacterium]
MINRTQLCDTMLSWPDTVLHLDYQVGLKEWSLKDPSTGNIDFSPNPVTENATFGFYLPSVYPATIAISDLSGRILYQHTFKLEQGYHRFQWTSGLKGMYVLSIEYAGMISSVKVISQGNGNTRDIQIEHLGVDSHEMNFRSASSSLGFEYTTGDILLIIGYSNGIESGMVDSPKHDKDYIVQLGSNISCPGIPSFNYGGQLYHTIQIFGQCWMKENLNIGTMIPGAQSMANNAVLEKYCHSDSQDSCTKYGGLYQWDEVMQYLVTGYQGICPQGWHLPIDEDWKVLEGAVDTHTAIGSPDWDNLNLRGVNSGENLKSSSFWLEGGNGSDAYGFDARPGGYLVQGGAFGSTGYDGLWWSSPVSSTSRAWTRYLSAVSDQSGRSSYDKSNSFSVRCIKDL